MTVADADAGRLHPARLAALPADVGRPGADRSRLAAGIVHLGVGAFMRAHLAVVTDAALAARPDDRRWGIVGVSLRHADTRDALMPQQGLYTVSVNDAQADGRPRRRLQVVGCLLDVQVAPEDPSAVVERIAHADTRIVTLTVTEKGYCHDPAGGALRFDHPDIAHDLQHADAPRSAVGFIVRGLALRRARGRGPLSLVSLDNLPRNGSLLRRAVLGFAARVDNGLRGWIDASCSFPSSMVDRIVPRTTDADRQAVAAALGLHDAWPVMTEPFLDWAVEDRFVAGRPDWQAGGARLVDDVSPWEALKLRVVNGAHSQIAYLGAVAGWRTVDAAMAQPALARHVESLLRDEVEPTLPPLPGHRPAVYRAALLTRFANPALAHRTQQIAMDGSQKLPQRILGCVRDRLAAGASIDRLSLGVAAWAHYQRGFDEHGEPYAVDDPLAAPLRTLHDRAESLPDDGARALAWTGFAPVFGDLAGNEALVRALARHLAALRGQGVQATLVAMPRRADD